MLALSVYHTSAKIMVFVIPQFPTLEYLTTPVYVQLDLLESSAIKVKIFLWFRIIFTMYLLLILIRSLVFGLMDTSKELF